MNMRAIDYTPDTPAELPDALTAAAALAKQLTDQGVEVHNAHYNGRRIVLLISAPPRFVIGAVKRHFPNGTGGTTSVHAASWLGCQLEWMTHTVGDRVVANG